MRNIRKRVEPPSLVTYRAQAGATYPDMPRRPVKDNIRDNLPQEQRFLCCYCMSRIGFDSMRIEHWHCQDEYPEEQLDYRNMLGACNGNEGNPPVSQHCDVRKGNRDLVFSPANPRHDVERRIRYLGDGTIESSNATFKEQLQNVLNLNFSRLKSNRQKIVQAVEEALNKTCGTRVQSQVDRLISKWDTTDSRGGRKEFCGVAIYFLKKRRKRA